MNDLKFHKLPELPKITFKAGKAEYSMTDLRYLNTYAVSMLIDIIDRVYTVPDFCEMTLTMPDEIPEEMGHVIADILMAVSWSAKKKGKGGYTIDGAFLVSGCSMAGSVLTVRLIPDHAKAIYEYAYRRGEKPSIPELVIVLAEATMKEGEL